MPAIRLFDLDEHLSTTREAFTALNDLIHHSRQSLKTERRKAERKALQRAKTTRIFSVEKVSRKEKEVHAVLGAYSSLIRKYCGYLPRLINYSCLVQLYALFEDRGTALCNELKRRDNTIPLRLDELGKPNFDTIKTYLTKLCGVQYKHWNEIQLLTQLRHRIVHNSGHTENGKLIADIKKTKGLAIAAPFQPPKSSADSPEFPDESAIAHPYQEKQKPVIVVKNEYVDSIVPIVSGLFDQVFRDKNFGDASPFIQSPDADGPIIVSGTGKMLKVRVFYND